MHVHVQGMRGKLSMISVVIQVQRFHSLTLVLIISAFESLLQRHNQPTECFLDKNEPPFTPYLLRIIFTEVLLFTVHWQVRALHTQLNTALKTSMKRIKVITEAQR